MTESFLLPVEHNGEQKEYDAELHFYGYTHKIAVRVNNTEVIFEPDEERNYRAVLPNDEVNKHLMDKNLLQVIAEKLEEIFK